jgi:hypothetical protein
MLGVLLILLLIALAVAALFLVGTSIIQGYLYNEPVEGIPWRSAASGVAVGLFFGLWCLIESRAPGQYETLLDFTPRETVRLPGFVSERTGDRGKQEITFTRGRDNRGRVVYTDPNGNVWQRSSANGMMTAIIVDEDGEKRRFEAELVNGGFKADRPARYVEQGGRGRVMTDDAIGEMTTTNYGLLVGNFLLNLGHLLVWFLCLWLLMQFHWPHALGLAVALWLAFGLAVWPVVRQYVPHG